MDMHDSSEPYLVPLAEERRNTIEFHPSSPKLALASTSVSTLDLESASYSLLGNFPESALWGGVTELAFSSSGEFLAAAVSGSSSRIVVWNLETGVREMDITLPDDTSFPVSLNFIADDTRLFVTTLHDLFIVDLNNPSEIDSRDVDSVRPAPGTDIIVDAAMSPTQDAIAIITSSGGSYGSHLLFVNTESLEALAPSVDVPNGQSIAFDPTGNLLTVAMGPDSSDFAIWNPLNGIVTRGTPPNVTIQGVGGKIHQLQFSFDSRFLASLSANPDVSNGVLLPRLETAVTIWGVCPNNEIGD